MAGRKVYGFVVALTAFAVLAAVGAPGACLEVKLAGIALGDTPEDLLASSLYGPPDGIFTPGNVFNSVKAPAGEVPPWAVAVRMQQLGVGQVEWVYNRDPVAVGAVISGEGINARVTDIVVSMWRTFDPSRIAQTSKGVQLGDSYASVLQKYGWPNRMQVISETGQTETAQRPAAARAARPAAGASTTGAPAGGLRLRLGGSREERQQPATRAPAAPRPAFGGVRLQFGAQRGQRPGPGPLPQVGAAAPARIAAALAKAPAGPTTSVTAPVGQTPNVTFTKSCIMSYPSVDFVIYRMKVFRIHVYGG